MRISQKATYGILAALDLALQDGTTPVQARAIARRQTIPIRFLEQVLYGMKRAGIIDSTRGAHGGYVLIKQPAEISLAEIVEALDGPLTPVQPEKAKSIPSFVGQSLLGPVWDRLRAAEQSVLATVKLTELVERYKQLGQERALMYHI